MLRRYVRDLRLDTMKFYLEGTRLKEHEHVQPEQNLVASELRLRRRDRSVDAVGRMWDLPNLARQLRGYLHFKRFGNRRPSARSQLPPLPTNLRLRIYQRLEIPCSSDLGRQLNIVDVVRCSSDWKRRGPRYDSVIYQLSSTRVGLARLRLIFEANLDGQEELFVLLEPFKCRRKRHTVECRLEGGMVVGLVDSVMRGCQIIRQSHDTWVFNEYLDVEMLFNTSTNLCSSM